ncbi:uncharacterized protein LOC122886147 isoform X1 [Siniperca chuatsi]|uniref:uncharacterized protein LOC122886147 isoform X1 n=1 Tax=Siniperca chuatsi TaxID=119488 RepID=UPI001CE137C7|nr:uncharacterized protein LOC122886147 isoform X1 [Siniperca chuatsi]
MVKFQSDFFCLHVIMFSLNQAALLFIQLLLTYQVFAGTHPFDHRDVLVSRGDSVMFTCNISNANTTQISWTKGRFVFTYSILHNQTFSNFTSHRLRIDLNLPSKLNIFSVQHDDAGLYVCNVTGKRGLATTEWNLTVSEKPEEISQRWYFLYILTPAIGFLLCGFTPAVCLCRNQSIVVFSIHAHTCNWIASMWLHSSCLSLQKTQDQDTKPEPSPGPVSSSVRRRGGLPSTAGWHRQ